MGLTLEQEQGLSSLLHYIQNEIELHHEETNTSIGSFLDFLDEDIVNQSGKVYSEPTGPGVLSNVKESG